MAGSDDRFSFNAFENLGTMAEIMQRVMVADGSDVLDQDTRWRLASHMTDAPAPDLRPATGKEIAETLYFAMRYNGGKRVYDADSAIGRIAAERLVQHLEASGFVVMKKPLAPTTRVMPPFIGSR